MRIRTVIFVVICSALWAGMALFDSAVQPKVATQLAVSAVNGGEADAAHLRESNQVASHVEMEFAGLVLATGVLCYGSVLNRALCPKGK